MASDKVFLYALVADGEIRYVGQTADPRRRMAAHLASVRKRRQTAVTRWIAKGRSKMPERHQALRAARLDSGRRIADQHGVVYNGAAAAARALGMPWQQHVYGVLLGQRRTARGYAFHYLEY